MSAKKRKPLGSAMEEFVFGDREATSAPTEPSVVSPVLTPTASQTPETVEAALPAPTPPSPEAPAAESIPVQLKESSLTAMKMERLKEVD